jgi:hypothetical protein
MQTDDEYSDERIPLGYLITFRSYGTWLHGKVGSVDRFHSTYGTPKLAADEKRKQYNRRFLKQPPVRLTAAQRTAILAAVKETCEIRKWELWASNIRSNHVHTVVSANCKPDPILNALKPMQLGRCGKPVAGVVTEAHGCIAEAKDICGGKKTLDNAIAYVLYEQGDSLP